MVSNVLVGIFSAFGLCQTTTTRKTLSKFGKNVENSKFVLERKMKYKYAKINETDAKTKIIIKK